MAPFPRHLGDANLSPFATRLKVGTMALVLELLATHPSPARFVSSLPCLLDPLAALRSISRDSDFRWEVTASNETATTALDIQWTYLDAVCEHLNVTSPERAQLVADWREVLVDLSQDPDRCRDRLDWAAKRALIRDFQKAQGLAEDDPWLQSLDLEYHRLDPDQGLYFGLEQSGGLRGIPPEDAVKRALHFPPESTRALIRGLCIQRFGPAVLSAQWDHVTLSGISGPIRISLLDLFASSEVARYRAAVETARFPDEIPALLRL